MIDSFTGSYWFLSNFAATPHCSYFTVEHAYQAAKTNDPQWEHRILSASTAGQAKKLGRQCPLWEDWEDIKLKVMSDLVREKFRLHAEYRRDLLATGEEELVEGNWWGDTYWGVCKGKGRNELGKLLMRVRDAYGH